MRTDLIMAEVWWRGKDGSPGGGLRRVLSLRTVSSLPRASYPVLYTIHSYSLLYTTTTRNSVHSLYSSWDLCNIRVKPCKNLTGRRKSSDLALCPVKQENKTGGLNMRSYLSINLDIVWSWYHDIIRNYDLPWEICSTYIYMEL